MTLTCPDDPSRDDQVRRVPASMTVQKLKGLIQRLYKVSSSEQILSYQSEVSRRRMGGVAEGVRWETWQVLGSQW